MLKRYCRALFGLADYNDTGDIPRVEDGKLIIANPSWGS